ncbi:MAG: HAD family hydrolase [Lachnospiraceae bacterium]
MYKACIFDIDGTLIDSVQSIAYVANTVLTTYGLAPQPVADYNYFAGEGADQLMRRCLRAAGDTDLVHYEEGRVLYRDLFAQNPSYKTEVYPGMAQTVMELKRRSMKLGVCSNKPHLAAIGVVEHFFANDVFAAIQGQQEGIPRKPDPAILLRMLAQFGVAAEECIYVGDTKTDMLTGQAAGAYTVGVTWGFRGREELEEYHADRIIDRPQELLEIE